jgi:Fe-S cluster assembly scaffold protein SufB
MQFKDISTSKKTSYVLKENEKLVFFLHNRSGTFDFVLAGTGAEAHIFALFDEKKSSAFSLEIRQHHTAPNTKSTALVKSLLAGNSSLSYQGLIRIEKRATRSDAKQENRNLLLSEEASAVSIPSLEILESDVVCEHASTTGTLSEEAILYMKTRGLDQAQAETLLAEGFRGSFYGEISKYGKLDEIKKYADLNF